MSLLDSHTLQCPYCFQSIEIVVDASVSHQEYIEDCSVCCRPILLNVVIDQDGGVQVDARQENE